MFGLWYGVRFWCFLFATSTFLRLWCGGYVIVGCESALWICAGDGDVVVVRWRWLWVVDPGDIDDLSGDDVDGNSVWGCVTGDELSVGAGGVSSVWVWWLLVQVVMVVVQWQYGGGSGI